MIFIKSKDVIFGYGKYTFDSFEFESGDVLDNVEVEYLIDGTPQFDENGQITNAVLFCHKFNGGYSISDYHELTKEGGAFDKQKYYIISITSLGFPESCSPSVTGLKHNFPKYSIKDRVNFKRKFIKEVLDIDKIHGLFGNRLGGYEVFTWACDYPDDMDFIILLQSSYKTYGYRYVISKCMDSIIESSDDYYNDIYNDSLSRIMVAVNKLFYSNYFSKKFFNTMSNEEIDLLMEDYVDEGLFLDIYDLKFRNDAIKEYDVENKLGNIKAKTLILSYTEDIYYSHQYDTLPLKNLIEGSKVIVFESKQDFIDDDDFAVINPDLKEFLKQFKK